MGSRRGRRVEEKGKNTGQLPGFYLWQHCGAIHGDEEPKRSGRWKNGKENGAPCGGRELRKSGRKTQLSGHSPRKMGNRWNWRVRLPVVKFSQSQKQNHILFTYDFIFFKKSTNQYLKSLKSYLALWSFVSNLPQHSWVFSFTKHTLWYVPESDSSYSRGHLCKHLQGSQT